jgi:hypothetical protein
MFKRMFNMKSWYAGLLVVFILALLWTYIQGYKSGLVEKINYGGFYETEKE